MILRKSTAMSQLKLVDELPAQNAEPVNILLVDDLPDKLMAYEAILEDLGQNIMIARSGEEALRMVLQHEFAVILLDVNMPIMDGFETATLIRSRKKSSHTPIIFLTAFNDEMRMAQGYASGAVDYLPTPVVPEILQAKVKVFIELSQMRRLAAAQAEERAMRRAAEESANRFAFLVNASEILSRPQNLKEILASLVRLTIPNLSDASMIWLARGPGEESMIEWAWSDGDGSIYTNEPGLSLQDVPWHEKAMMQVFATNELQLVEEIPSSRQSLGTDGMKEVQSALVIPLIVCGQICGALTCMRAEPYNADDISLASDFASRASVTIENTMLMEKIKEGDHRKDEFLATLAHELRNPLAPIRNALHIMKMTQDGGKREQAIETIDRQLKHMIHLIDDLMDISRITQGKIELRKEIISLNDALNHAVETVEPFIKAQEHTLNITMPKETIWLNADPSRISQIFSNLLNNAAKYTDKGGHIELTTELRGNTVTVTVKDDGIGVPEHMLGKIFDMFSQVDSSLERAQGGLGIGLTLVKSLVNMHGGTIQAESEGEHKGCIFQVTLPTTLQTNAAPAVEEPKEEHASSVLRVLVVDDNEASAKTMGWMVELAGHEIMLAHDGPSAIEIANNYKPTVVLLDIGLPGMNGYEVCKAMKQNPALKNTYFIAQTGWGQEEHRQRSKEAGFDYHLVKPVDMKELQQLIQNITPENAKA